MWALIGYWIIGLRHRIRHRIRHLEQYTENLRFHKEGYFHVFYGLFTKEIEDISPKTAWKHLA